MPSISLRYPGFLRKKHSIKLLLYFDTVSGIVN